MQIRGIRINPVSYTHLDVYKRQEQGYTFAVVLDLSKYFDTLNHEILINLLRKNVKDERVVPVSYTHLDVYKRQPFSFPIAFST